MNRMIMYSGLASLLAFVVGTSAVWFKVKELNKTWKLF